MRPPDGVWNGRAAVVSSVMAKNTAGKVTRQASKSTQEIFDSFILLNAMLHSLSSMLAAETRLAMSDLVANEHIRINRALTPKEISHWVQMGSGATTALIDRLESKGFVRRVPHPSDRRSIVVESLAGTTTSSARLFRFLEKLQQRVDALDPAVRPEVIEFLTGVSSDIVNELDDS
jgi:DNA-binding MarR family transcriptional regulator